LFAVAKNLKNRYRDIAMEALELHKRFPFAVCGHLVFLGKSESLSKNQAFGTTVGEAVALLSNIAGRKRVDESPEVYEEIGVLLLDPGKPRSVDTAPAGVPPELHAETYVERMIEHFKRRNPFYFGD
jgi:hypothetical protein